MTKEMRAARPYIRPCGAFPDGYEIPPDIVPSLLSDGLIAESEEYPGDYEAVYSPWDDHEQDEVAHDIEEAVRRWIAPWAQ